MGLEAEDGGCQSNEIPVVGAFRRAGLAVALRRDHVLHALLLAPLDCARFGMWKGGQWFDMGDDMSSVAYRLMMAGVFVLTAAGIAGGAEHLSDKALVGAAASGWFLEELAKAGGAAVGLTVHGPLRAGRMLLEAAACDPHSLRTRRKAWARAHGLG